MKPETDPTADSALPCSTTITCRRQAIDFLLGRINYERTATVPYSQRQLKLDRMRKLLNRLGNPDAGLPIVHVAGTKGKGSTSALVAAILSEAGYETGLFSSPHLESIEERFSINGQPISADELIALTERLRPVVEAMDREATTNSDSSLSPTYFELTTALALMHFAERNVDLAVLEVGLGGRLDSTNVCQPVVSVITSISFDHTKQLGNTLAEIAGEKAGIIKPGVPVLCGSMLPEPQAVIADVARQHGCRLQVAGVDFQHQYSVERSVGRISFRYRNDQEDFQLAPTPFGMLGAHQAANAALALATVAELRRQGWLVSTEAMRRGLAKISMPARVEVICRDPTIVLDVAHNVASAEALVEVLQAQFTEADRTLLVAVSRDKDVAGIVRTLVPHFSRIVVTEYCENPRAVPTAKLTEIVRQEVDRISGDHAVTEVLQEPDPLQAWKKVQATLRTGSLACVTGSFFIAAELRRVLLATCSADQRGQAEFSSSTTVPGNS